MAVRKRRKSSRMHGSHTHGWGAKKKHRGAGSRGGRGRAGRGKRAATNKPSFHRRGEFLGRVGFTMHRRLDKPTAVNLDFIQTHLDGLMQAGKVEKQGEFYVVDAEKLGYGKVLGSGKLNVKLQIKAAQFSKKAQEKIKEAGGQVITIGEKTEE